MNKLTHEEFLKKLKEKNKHYRNGEFEVVGEYTTSRDKILCRNQYGDCLITPKDLYRSRYCNILQTIDKTSYFINQAREVHGDRYDYSKVEYLKKHNTILIICPKHGVFKQTPNNHLQGAGCLKCAQEKSVYSLLDWKQMCPGNPGIFYVLRCWNDEEEFYKVGITCQDSVESRYSGNKMPYKYEIVKQVVDQDREKIWKLEKEYLSLNKDNSYEPFIKFAGSSKECFKTIKM